MTSDSAPPSPPHLPIARGALGAWWWQGLRSALLLRPAWGSLQTTPSIVVCLVLAPLLLSVLVERLYIVGTATFYWPALLAGWLATAVMVWVCWLLVPRPHDHAAQRPPTAVGLFSMLCAQLLTIVIVWGLVFVPLTRSGYLAPPAPARWATWLAWLLGIGWYAGAQSLLLWRSGAPGIALRCGAISMLALAVAVQMWAQPVRLWYPSAPPDAEADGPGLFKLTQELLELQPPLLQAKLAALTAERPGVVDVYAITFAPYASEEVFKRESDLVATLMQQRFGAAGKTIELINHESTVREWPWATPLNLQRAIQRAGELMNRDEDLLFIHLTSHGTKDGQLSAEFWPLTIDPVTPTMLKRWLDEAGIRFRIVSVSACYSGSWIEPLAGPETLVMTAADADHTSFGCGSRSPLTYFGRAMFDEQLRHTWSFEKAHAAARAVIEQREREAGKSDGYSNPQIRVGDEIRDRLVTLEAQRATDAAPAR